MIHHGQCLTFGFEPGDDLLGIHPQLDDLQGDLTRDRLGLFGHVNDPHTAHADFLKQLVAANDRAGTF